MSRRTILPATLSSLTAHVAFIRPGTAMYGRHFESMYTGSMVGAGSDVFAVWGYVISHCRDGIVELNPKVVAAMIGCEEGRIEEALEYLQTPDPQSRCQNNKGRRIVKIKPFVYEVSSWDEYQTIGKEADRREYLRVKQAESRARARSPHASEPLTRIYFIQCGDSVKIGHSKNPSARARELAIGMPKEPLLLGSYTAPVAEERKLHKKFKKWHERAEWFKATEDFLADIAQLLADKQVASRSSKTNVRSQHTKKLRKHYSEYEYECAQEDKEEFEEKKGIEKLKAEFEKARIAYPGTKRGLDTEWDNFTRKHKDWRDLADGLILAIEAIVDRRQRAKTKGRFVPEWAHFKTWINNRRWEEALQEEPE